MVQLTGWPLGHEAANGKESRWEWEGSGVVTGAVCRAEWPR